MEFKNYNFKDYINKGLEELEFFETTEIQEVVIPHILKGESVIGKSATGSGKTHAFLLPILERLDPSKPYMQALIISPTRELASQLFSEVTKITKHNPKIEAKLYVGGTNRENEIAWLEKKQPHIAVSTIGKLKDLAVSESVLKIYTTKMVVIDEADMVFESSELKEIDSIFSLFQEKIQTCVFSATISKNLIGFLNKYLSKTPVYDIDKENISKATIEHIFVPTKNKNKLDLLCSVLSTFHPYLCLIFANTKEKVNEVSLYLGKKGFNNVRLSGDLESRERKQVLKRIKDGDIQYVVASDLASRGIDIKGVSHVVNFELPQDYEFYIHRAGRTARYDGSGKCISLYDFSDNTYIQNLRSRGLHCVFMSVKGNELVILKQRDNTIIRKSSFVKKIENELHSKTPMPKKVKPGYKKKRNEEIQKQVRKLKRKHIQEIYKKRNGMKNEN